MPLELWYNTGIMNEITFRLILKDSEGRAVSLEFDFISSLNAKAVKAVVDSYKSLLKKEEEYAGQSKENDIEVKKRIAKGIKARKKENFNTPTTASFLGISRPTYQNLEKGINIEKYENRLEHYYNSGHSANQKKILKV